MQYHGGPIPYGYRLNHRTREILRDEVEQMAILYARELHAAGVGYRAIGSRLDEAGFRARRGWWHPTQVRRIIEGNSWFR